MNIAFVQRAFTLGGALLLATFVSSGCSHEANSARSDNASNAREDLAFEPTIHVKLANRLGDGEQIALDIPVRFAGRNDDFVDPLYSYGFFVTSVDMKGMHQAPNLDAARCAGYCRGLTYIYFTNSSNHYDKRQELLQSYLRVGSKYILVTSGSFSSRLEEYDVMWRTYPYKPWPETSLDSSHSKPSGGILPPIAPPRIVVPPKGYVTRDVYDAYMARPWPVAHIVVFRNANGEPDVVECSTQTSNNLNKIHKLKMCTYAGVSQRYKKLSVLLSFHYEDLRRWPKLKNDLFSLVEGFVDH